MASYTTNLNLKKPSGSENVAISDINGNMDTIDSAFGNVQNMIQSKILPTKTSSATRTINLPNNARATLTSIASVGNYTWDVIVTVGSNGSVVCIERFKGSGITIDSSQNNKLVITSSGSAHGIVLVMASTQSMLNNITSD